MKRDKAFYWQGSHTNHCLLYHVIFVPKYRRKVLRGRLIYRIQELFFEACKMNKWFIHEISIQTDHVHILIQLPSNVSLSKAVGYLKGGSSKIIRQEFPELKEFLWGDSLWQDGYFAETSGRLSENLMRRYIKNQWKEEA